MNPILTIQDPYTGFLFRCSPNPYPCWVQSSVWRSFRILVGQGEWLGCESWLCNEYVIPATDYAATVWKSSRSFTAEMAETLVTGEKRSPVFRRPLVDQARVALYSATSFAQAFSASGLL